MKKDVVAVFKTDKKELILKETEHKLRPFAVCGSIKLKLFENKEDAIQCFVDNIKPLIVEQREE